MKVLSIFVEFLFAIRIALSPFLAGCIAGALCFLKWKGTTGILLAIGSMLLGLTGGIFWAVLIWEKHTASGFMAKVNASPELDEKNGTK
jgi:hypothetical protein